MLQIELNHETDQLTNGADLEAFGHVIGQNLTSAASGVISNATGTVTSGAVGVVDDGPSLKPYSSIYVVAKDKPGSVSAITFTLEQIVWVNNAFQVFLIGYITSTPGNPAYAYFPLPQPKTNSTFRAIVSAAHAYPTGADNFNLTVTGF